LSRMLAAILLASSAYAFAQNPQVAEDQKQLQGIWRVREVVGPAEAAAQWSRMQFAFEGNKLLPLAGRDTMVSAELSYSIDPTKNPKQIDFVQIRPQRVAPGQKPAAPQQVILLGIYAFDQGRLKLRFAGERRPLDFSTRPQSEDLGVLILKRDTSPAARAGLQDARAMLAIRQFGVEAFSDNARPLPPRTPYVKFYDTHGDALLMKIAPQVKSLSRCDGLYLNGSKVTDAGLACLEGLNNIEQINLEKTAITDAGLEHLRKMTGLRRLIVSDTKVTRAGIARLQQVLPQLQVSSWSRAEILSQLAITNAGGMFVSDQAGRLLTIRFAQKLSDFQLLGLQKHLEVWETSLHSIDLTGSEITDRGLAALAGLTSLEQLALTGNDVTVAGVKSLKRTVPSLKVKH
jgi:uncharacterized protein (TIGR03067 family)